MMNKNTFKPSTHEAEAGGHLEFTASLFLKCMKVVSAVNITKVTFCYAEGHHGLFDSKLLTRVLSLSPQAAPQCDVS